MKKMACVVALLMLGSMAFAADKADKKEAAKPEAAVAVPQPKVVVPPAGQWTGFEYGQYVIATGNGNSNIVLAFSTWDPIIPIPGVAYNWSKEIQQKDVDRTTKAYKLAQSIALIPGVVDVVIAKHRVDVQRAFVYSWESILPQLLEAFRKSDLVKQGG
jgi:hypothetical protein